MRLKSLITLCLLLSTVIKSLGQESNISTSELIINSTIRIEGKLDSIFQGQKVQLTSTGTGFYFTFKIDSLYVPVIVTNYHVIKKTYDGKLVFTIADGGRPSYGSKITKTFPFFDSMWIKHPDVDLAILPLNPIIEDIKKTYGKDVFTIPYTEDLLPNEQLISSITAIEEVLMVGYPRGISDSINNLPIVRKGTSATPIYLDYNSKKQFLLDIPIYGGSSGSPILLFNQGSYSTRKGGIVVGTRLALLGINVQSINYNAHGELVLPPNNPKFSTSTNIPLNIAVVIKSEELLDFKPLLKDLIMRNNNKK